MKIKFQYFLYPGLTFFYFATRLFNLKIIPIFTDEAIYSFWAQVALHDPANRFMSLEDGKQPLFIWLAAIFQKFIEDPLIATRLVSVFAGFGSLVGIYLLAKILFNKKIAILSSFLYIILPFTLLYDRMALFDSLLTMFGIYAVLFTVKMIKAPKLDIAILNGFSIGLGMITKSSAAFYLYWLPFSLLLFNFKEKNITRKIFKWAILSVATFIIAQIIYNSLRLSPLFYIIARKNHEFIRSFSEVFTSPFTFFNSNIHAMTGWIITYLSLPLFIVFIFAVIFGFFKKKLEIIYLSILILIPFFAEVFFNKVLHPRFILFYIPYVIILISFAIFKILEIFKTKEKYLMFVLSLILVIPIFTSFRLLTNPPRAQIADNDRGQYFNDWPAGYGVAQITQMIKDEAKNKSIYIGTEGTFGLLPFALQIYFYGQNNVHIIGFWPVDSDNLPLQILTIAKSNKTYFIFNENQKEITSSHLKFLVKYKKGIGNSYMRLYEIIPQ